MSPSIAVPVQVPVPINNQVTTHLGLIQACIHDLIFAVECLAGSGVWVIEPSWLPGLIDIATAHNSPRVLEYFQNYPPQSFNFFNL